MFLLCFQSQGELLARASGSDSWFSAVDKGGDEDEDLGEWCVALGFVDCVSDHI